MHVLNRFSWLMVKRVYGKNNVQPSESTERSAVLGWDLQFRNSGTPVKHICKVNFHFVGAFVGICPLRFQIMGTFLGSGSCGSRAFHHCAAKPSIAGCSAAVNCSVWSCVSPGCAAGFCRDLHTARRFALQQQLRLYFMLLLGRICKL